METPSTKREIKIDVGDLIYSSNKNIVIIFHIIGEIIPHRFDQNFFEKTFKCYHLCSDSKTVSLFSQSYLESRLNDKQTPWILQKKK